MLGEHVVAGRGVTQALGAVLARGTRSVTLYWRPVRCHGRASKTERPNRWSRSLRTRVEAL